MLKKAAVLCLVIGCIVTSDTYPQSLRSIYRASGSTLRIREARTRQSPAAADTVRLLGIRAEFRTDSVSTTTGTGRFDLSSSASTGIDPPPHNRSYFQAQLLALANYYSVASGGRLVLQAEVFPAGENAAYQLPRNMSYYSPGRASSVADQRLSELFRDALQAADQDGGIDFSRFDSFIVFHAGVGNDFSIEFDSTPNDVPSAFLTLDDLRSTIGNNDPAFAGVAVQGGAFHVPDGLILPETQSQEGVEFGLLGTVALMFGHQLGLPNLFNTENGLPGIGRWGLMDQGSGNFQGLLPALPSAWERAFLGWEQPVTVTSGENLSVAALVAGGSPGIYKIPITDDEYFLIENRQADVYGDALAIGYDVNGTRIEFKYDNFGNPYLQPPEGATIGVIVRVDEYDFGLPYAVDEMGRLLLGAGILIWHIDEQVIRENYASNRVNANRDRRGVDLEEADGAQDIGRVYGFLEPGSGAENGVLEDAWWKSNPVITKFLRPNEPVTFGPATLPSSASSSGAFTGISVTNFSESQAVMTFSVRNAFALAGFPQYAGGGAAAFSPVLADLNGDDRADIVVTSATGKIFAWQDSGRKVIANGDSVSISQPNGLTVRLPVALFAEVGDSLFHAPALADLNGDGGAEVLAAGKDGVLRVWQATDQNLDGRADLLWQANLGSASRTNLVIRPETKRIFCTTEDSQVLAFTPQGTLLWQHTVPTPARGIGLLDDNQVLVTLRDRFVIFMNDEIGFRLLPIGTGLLQNLVVAAAIADIENDNSIEAVIRDHSGHFTVVTDSYNDKSGFPISINGFDFGAVAVGDVDTDGRKEIVIVSSNKIYVYHFNGVLADNFPQPLGSETSSPHNLAPIIADVDNDGVQDVLAAGPNGNVYAYNRDGKLLDGFPLAMTGPGIGSLAAGDLDGDGKLELVGVSGNGFVHAWHLPQSGNSSAWPMLAHDAMQTSLNSQHEIPAIRNDGLMPTSLVYNYPNPTEGQSTTIRYRLNNDASVKISIYDVAGDLIEELSGPGLAQAENEVTWNLGKVESGVYLARVEAQGSGETQVAVIKIAVVK
jgi:M6 family metalloprotease-like protein